MRHEGALLNLDSTLDMRTCSPPTRPGVLHPATHRFRVGAPAPASQTVPVQRARSNPRILLAIILGNLAFIGSWVLVFYKPAGWLGLSLTLLLAFLALRVGAAWWQARQFPDEKGIQRRAAIITTVLAVLAVGLWAFSIVYGPRSAPRVERRVIYETPAPSGSGERPASEQRQ